MRALLAVIAAFISFSAFAKVYPSKAYIDKAFKDIAKEQNIDEILLRSVCFTESGHKPYVFAFGDNKIDDHAFGICQVLYSTAKTMGLRDDNCLRDFSDFKPSERVYKACKLFGPRTNMRYAARYLKFQLKRYEGDEFKAILSYNSGRYITCKNGWLHINQVQEDGTYKRIKFKRCLKGGPVNLYYANRVLHYMESRKVNGSLIDELNEVEELKED